MEEEGQEQQIQLDNEPIIYSSTGGAVNSVNGYTGDVVLTTSDLENTSDYQTGSEVESAISTAIAGKQNTLTAGSNITIENDTISATDTTYTAGYGLGLSGTEFAVDNTTIATQDNVTNLQGQIDALAASSDVADIVGTYADLMAYDTSTLTDMDIIGVLNDETHGGESTYYRYSKTTGSWTYIGSTGQRAKQSDWDEDDSTDMAFIKNKPFYSESVESDFEQEPTTTSGSTPDTNYVWFIEQFQDYALHEVLADFNDGDTVYAIITYSVDGVERSDTGKFTLTFENDQANLDYDAQAGSRWYGAYISEVNLGDTTVRWPVLATDSGATVYITNIEYSRIKQVDAEYIPIDNDTITVDANGKLKSSGGGSSVNVVQTTGTSTTDVMSQNATTSMVFADPGTDRKVRIGNTGALGSDGIAIGYSAAGKESEGLTIAIGSQAEATGYRAVALGFAAKATDSYAISVSNNNGPGTATASGYGSTLVGHAGKATATGSLALGAYSNATVQGQADIGTTSTYYGYNSSNYRLLTGLYDGQSAHDAATKGQLDGRILTNAGAPTTATVGTVGQLLEDTTNGDLYICTAIVPGTDPDPDTYTWEEVGSGGGSGPTVVQTTGTSTTDVMSQNATTGMVFADPGTNSKIRIGNTNQCPATGVSIGRNANANVGIGKEAGVALGMVARAAGTGAIALGARSNAASQGQFDVSTDLTSYGYNNSNYRLLTGLYDGQSAHDAATVAQGNTLATSAPTTATVGVLGQLYTDTTGMHTYQCTAINGNEYTWTQRW